ncbi:MAG TPA: hypothetical protein EYP22_06820 [Methanosarcinales archaeon]|nr:hypothetical protein [Methanosarcinales archaeon]
MTKIGNLIGAFKYNNKKFLPNPVYKTKKGIAKLRLKADSDIHTFHTKTYTLIAQELKLRLTSTSPSNYIPRFCTVLGLNRESEKEIRKETNPKLYTKGGDQMTKESCFY